MNDQVTKLINKIKAGARPDLKSTKLWLDAQGLTREELDLVLDTIEKCYDLTPDAFDAAIEEPGKNLDYVDDFLPLMHNVKGWLADYVEHTKGMEAPTAFHFATGLTVLGASLKRRCWVDQNAYKIYPAVQTLLVGPSGKVKKSTTGNYGVRLIGQERAGYKPAFNRLLTSGTGEALFHELSVLTNKQEEATGLLYVSELGTFLGKQEYNTNLVQILTDLFDCPDFLRRRTKGGGDEVLKNVAVSTLFCSNEDWLADAIPATAFGGGFFGRMLVFYQASTDRCFSRPRKISDEERDEIVNALEPVRFIKGEAILTPSADKLYDDYYLRHKDEWPEEERIVPFYERLPDHVLRMSMLLSVSEDPKRESPVITERHIEKAIEILSWVFKYLPRVYSHLGGTKFGIDQVRIYEIIKRAGGQMEKQELGRRMSRRLSNKQLTEHLETMKLNGVLIEVNADPWEGKRAWKLVRKMD